MPKKKKVLEEDLIVPPQDNRICGTICICQMTMVLSCVAIVYLTVAVYMPSLRAFLSTISATPVMCTTSKKLMVDKDGNSSCSEWCLSKSSGSCTEIWVSVRQNGSDLNFVNCTETADKTCYGIDQAKATKYSCILEGCRNLTGTYNCTNGECVNITDAFDCVYKTTDVPLVCSGKRGKITCMELQGLQVCVSGECRRILPPYNCDRKCVDIPTRNKNVILLSGDTVTLSQCQRGFFGEGKTGVEVWNDTSDKVLMASCYTIHKVESSNVITGTDCINGTLLNKTALSQDFANFTYLTQLSVTNEKLLDEDRKIAPPELDLLLSNESQLFINMEGCVNTLANECEAFFEEYGKDGTDHNARARYPCFHDEADPRKVYARFDLEGTYKEFLFASTVPTTLFVVSCIVLVICQKTVEVGDDAKMRFKFAADADNPPDKENSVGDASDHAMAL